MKTTKKTKIEEIGDELRKKLKSKGYLKGSNWTRSNDFFDGKLYVQLEVGSRNVNIGIYIYTGQSTRKLRGVNIPIKNNPSISEIIKIYNKYLKHTEKFYNTINND